MRRTITAVTAVCAVAVLALAGCSTTVQGSAQAGTTLSSSTPTTTTTSTTTSTTRTSARTSEETSTSEDTTTSEDSTSEETTSQDTETTETSQGASGLDPVTEEWFIAFCARAADAGQYVTEVTNQTLPEAQKTIVDTYTNISLSAATSVGLLQQTPPPAVSGGQDIASKAIEYFTVAADVYGRGALTIAALTPTNFNDLQVAKDAVEAEATASIPSTMSDVDPSVLAAAQQLPDCQGL